MTSENRNRYVLMQEVAELAIMNGGTIFGGFVRDFLLHEHASKEFYNNHNGENYNCVKIAPELKDRFLVAMDVDVRFESREQFASFKSDLENKMSYKIRFGPGSYGKVISMYLSLEIKMVRPPIPSFAKRLITNQIMECVKIVPGGDFKVDVVIGNEPLNQGLDFECNGLVMNSNGIQLGPELSYGLSPIGKFRRLEEIKSDILKKRALGFSFNEKRWKKMDEKGDWEIITDVVCKVKPEQGDMCVICHDENPMYKFTCCNARYDFLCMKKVILHDNKKCPHCREEFGFGEEAIKVFSG